MHYGRLLRLETQIAKEVLERMLQNDGVYIPYNIVHGRHVYFAIDNIDFAEDTPNGKRTLHGTVMDVYQQRCPEDTCQKLVLHCKANMRSLKDIPKTISELLPCQMPKAPKPPSPSYPTFIMDQAGQYVCYEHQLAWLLGQTLSRWDARN